MNIQNLQITAVLVIVFGLNSIQITYAETVAHDTAMIKPQMTVYKTPSCGCCEKWVSHIDSNSFLTSVVEMNDLSSIKSTYTIHGRYRSCHTGVVSTKQGDFVFEGHVPAKHVKAFLKAPPLGAIGLSVPGMPVGSPGMEVGDHKAYYQVLLLNQDGSSSVFAHVNRDQ